MRWHIYLIKKNDRFFKLNLDNDERERVTVYVLRVCATEVVINIRCIIFVIIDQGRLLIKAEIISIYH